MAAVKETQASAPAPATAPSKAAIRDRALALGFDAVGFAPADLGPAAGQTLIRFLEQGYHGDMGWLAAHAERRANPNVLWPQARTVIVLGANYAPHEDPCALLGARERGVISLYARNRDYHDVLKKRLKALARWMAESFACQVKVFVDTAPVMEKPLAARAGLGWQGKHTNLVSRRYGSWLFLGEVFTDLVLTPDAPEDDHCGRCRRCLDACPTQAFPAPYRLDARRCISYLTIEHKGHIAAEFRAAMGNRIYGCDDCLAVCPWNKFAMPTREAAFLPRAELTGPRLAELATLDDAAFRRRFAGTAIKRTGRDRFVRNVLIALGNSGDPTLAAVAEKRLDDASPLVRAMAVWALLRLGDPATIARARARSLAVEADPAVRAEWEVETRERAGSDDGIPETLGKNAPER
ncbi:MAG: tRNA epoxyqueuosine(34) reductase QueG [Alphaproteobacteria bacterium]|nr:MAG: tRNA epoxyqueuosine(34) reductase QueG [Alphaproteobacteria bacterium]